MSTPSFKYGNGVWATKSGSSLAYNDDNGHYKPLPFSVSRASSATRVNKQGLIEVVGNDRLRIDYSESAKGVALLEPSRSNVALYSEEFDNAWWAKSDVTISANSIVSPDGSLNADKITEGTNNVIHAVFRGNSLTQTSIVSIFAKKGDGSKIAVGNSSDGHFAIFDLNLGIVTRASFGTISDGKIEDYGNGWYRCSCLFNYAGANKSAGYALVNDSNATTYTGDGVSSIYVWGAMIEAGSYATSYIPTSGSTATRQADVANGAGVANVFNDSEGVLFADIATFDDSSIWRGICISDGTTNNRVAYYATGRGNANEARFDVIVGGSFQVLYYVVLNDITNSNKVAIKYKTNDVGMWVNGFRVAVDTSATMPTGLSTLQFSNGNASTPAEPYYGKAKGINVYQTALTDAELEYLTSYRSLAEMVTELNLNAL